MHTRVIQTFFVTISILSSILLWLTKSEWQPSLSAFALSDNAIWYRLMHITASWFLIIKSYRYSLDLYIGLGMGLILAFDMYNFPLLHNIITGATLLFACLTLIYESKEFERKIMIFLCTTAVGIFLTGFLVDSFHLLTAEIVAISCLMCGKLREVWN